MCIRDSSDTVNTEVKEIFYLYGFTEFSNCLGQSGHSGSNQCHALGNAGASFTVVWCPGHAVVEGNEEADGAA